MKSLTKREKLLLKILFICILGTVVYYLVVLPLIGLARNAEDELKGKKDELEKLERIYKQYRDIQQKKSTYISMLNKKNENTVSLIEQWANSTGIKKNITRTNSKDSNIQNKYTRITTDIKIESVAIQQFLEFLYEVENSDNLIKVNYLRIYPVKGTNTYDIYMKIDNFISK